MFLKEIIDVDLAGFCLRYGYSMEIRNHLRGYFPAITAQSGRVVVCFHREHLKMIWEKLPRREVKVSKHLFLTDENARLAIPIEGGEGDVDRSRLIFSIHKEYELEAYLRQEGFFKWQGGELDNLRAEVGAIFPEERKD